MLFNQGACCEAANNVFVHYSGQMLQLLGFSLAINKTPMVIELFFTEGVIKTICLINSSNQSLFPSESFACFYEGSSDSLPSKIRIFLVHTEATNWL